MKYLEDKKVLDDLKASNIKLLEDLKNKVVPKKSSYLAIKETYDAALATRKTDREASDKAYLEYGNAAKDSHKAYKKEQELKKILKSERAKRDSIALKLSAAKEEEQTQ